tara:strand:+ start:894 stop:1508 length:615 start_codon:yes stop_codon:yes gene_type:complete
MNKEMDNTYYDYVYRTGGWNKMYLKDDEESIQYSGIWNYIIELIKRRSDRDVLLDIGCGNGQFARYIYNRGIRNRYIGYDFSEYAIKYANSKKKSNSNFEVVNFKSMGQRTDTSNSLYICLEVLEHINDDKELIEKLTPGVDYIFSVPNYWAHGHVRIYEKEADIRSRYGGLLNINSFREFKIGYDNRGKIKRVFIFTGSIKAR